MKRIILIGLMLYMHIDVQSQQFTKQINSIVCNDAGDSRSVNWVDINNDGLLDLMITNGLNVGENNFLYINKGNGEFEKIDSTEIIVNDKSPSDGASWADVDNDGDMDCYVVTWYNKRNLFYINEGNNHFRQVKTGSIALDLTYSETASWADYDNDGKLDLYITNSEGQKRNALFKGNGDTSFTKVLTGSQSTDAFNSRTVNWVDIDNDNDLDIFVTNESNQNENLYLNKGDGTFEKNTTCILVNLGKSTISSSWGDYDNDGDQDVILCNDGSKNLLYRNEGNLNFTEQSFPTDSFQYSFGSAWGDIDNDGDLDLYITNAFGPNKMRNQMYINTNGVFTMDTTNVTTLDSGWSYGCAFGDYNNDGFLDLATANCFEKTQNNSLYLNNGNGNAWFVLECVGTISNKSGIGAKVKIKANINGQNVWQMREINTQSGHNGQNMIAAHFGLGNVTIIDSLIIEWPSNKVDKYTNIAINKKLKALEDISLGKNHLINEHSLMNIYPNPAKNSLTVSIKHIESGGYKLLIYDALGKTIDSNIFKIKGKEYSTDITLEKYKSGNYILVLKNNSDVIVKTAKFIKQ